MFVAQSYDIALILFRVAEFAAHEGIEGKLRYAPLQSRRIN